MRIYIIDLDGSDWVVAANSLADAMGYLIGIGTPFYKASLVRIINSPNIVAIPTKGKLAFTQRSGDGRRLS